MKKYFLIISLALSVFLNACSHTATHNKLSRSQKNTIVEEIEQIISSIDTNVNIGFDIFSLDQNESIASKNADRHYLPASTIKIITVAAALYYLGPAYRFETTVLSDHHHLYLKGSGDPSLSDSDLVNLAQELKQLGIAKIDGNLIVDDHIFDSIQWGKGAMWDDRDNGYGAPVSGLNLNYNRLMIKTLPGLKSGTNTRSLLRPATQLFSLESKALTKANNSPRLLTTKTERSDSQKDGLKKGDKIIISGQTPLNAGPFYSMLAVNDPSILAGTFFKEQLSKLGISINGSVERGTTPPSALVLSSHQSRSLSEALIDFTKISNDVANDSLVKAIASSQNIIPASFSAGMKLISDFLYSEVGIDPGTLIAADGSGLSRYNLISPRQMVKILNYAANNFQLGPEFMTTLPIAGLDGTLSARLKEDHVQANIRAKTGAMSGISCMAGYFSNQQNQRFAFAIMINGFVGQAKIYSSMQDQILGTLLKNSHNQVASSQ